MARPSGGHSRRGAGRRYKFKPILFWAILGWIAKAIRSGKLYQSAGMRIAYRRNEWIAAARIVSASIAVLSLT